jgi:O-antigen/teichoic acid export membrane protein
VKRRLLSGSAWAFAGKIVTVLTALVSNALLARVLSPQDFGLYFLAFSVVSVGAVLASSGLEQAVVRFVAESLGLNKVERARRALGRALVLGVLGSLVVATAYLLFFGHIVGNNLFHAPALTAVTGLVAGWIVVMALQALLAGAFQGFHDIRLFTVSGGLATGVLLATSLGVLWLLEDQASLTVVLLLAISSGFANVVLAGWLLHRKAARLPSQRSESEIMGYGEIMHVAWPLMVTKLTIFVLTQADLWILGAFLPPERVAIYGAAARAVFLVIMPLLIVQYVLPPLVAEMYSQGRERELERTLRATATLAGIPAFLVVAAFLLFGGPILGLVFGDYYRQGATILALLSGAQLVNVWTGVSMVALSYTGYQTAIMKLSIAGSLVTVVAGLAVVGSYGATGVAVVVAASVTIYNVVLLLVAKRKTGMWTHAGFSGFSDAIRAARRRGG